MHLALLSAQGILGVSVIFGCSNLTTYIFEFIFKTKLLENGDMYDKTSFDYVFALI